MPKSLRLAILTLSTLAGAVLVGCSAERHSATRGDGRGIVPAEAKLARWSAESVNLQCSSGDCPDGVGAVIFVNDLPGGGQELSRCTATLVAVDRILTNGHCGREFEPTRVIFFFRAGGKTLNKAVGPRLFHAFGFAKDEEGISEDLSLYQLREPATEATPLKISRKTPVELENPVLYVVNQAMEGRLMTDLVVKRKECTVRPHQPVFLGGAEDRGVGLSLFDCEIVEGNSGSPVFTGGDFTTVQAVLNSVYFFAAGGKSVERFFKLFEKIPSTLSGDFAMANRVHCLNIADLPEAEFGCPIRHLDELMFDPLRTAATQAVDELQQGIPDGPVVWSYDLYPLNLERTIPGLIPGLEFKREARGLVFAAKPLCVRFGTATGVVPAAPSASYTFFQSELGEPVRRLQEKFSMRAEVEILSDGTYSVKLAGSANVQVYVMPNYAVPVCTGGELEASQAALPDDLKYFLAD